MPNVLPIRVAHAAIHHPNDRKCTRARVLAHLFTLAALGCGDTTPPLASAPPSVPSPSTAAAASSTPNLPTSPPTAAATGHSIIPPAAPLAGSPSTPPSAGTSGRPSTAPLDDDAGMMGMTQPSDSPAQPALPCPTKAYVSNSGSDSVSVIDTSSHRVIATIPTDKAPVNPTFTPDRRQVYVANSQASTLTVIDVATDKPTTMPAGGERPSGLAFSPDGQTLFVSLIGQDYVSPGAVLSITLATGQPSMPLRMGADPERIALTPAGDRLYVNNLLDGTMAVLDTASFKIITTLMLGDLPFNPLMSPDGSVVYVGVMSASHIAVIDTKTNQITRTIPADSPNGLTFSKDYQSLIVSNALSGTVQQVSLTANAVLKTQTVGGLPGNIALLPDGKHAYMVRPDGTTVEVLDADSLMIVDTITVGTGPSVVTIARCPAPGDVAP